MEMILSMANAAGGMVAAFATVGIWEALRLLSGRKVDAEVAALRRRLADVEAIRGRERDAYRSRSIIREHIGEPPFPRSVPNSTNVSHRPVCDETEGDCA